MRARGLFLSAALLFAGALGRDAFDRWVDATVVPPLAVETSVEMLDRKGELLRAYTVADGRWRLAVSLATVDPSFVEMLIAYEDKRFYRHNGVDLRAMARAFGQAVFHGKVVSGGSTLTMQVARLLEDGPTGTAQGKLRQIRLALALERRADKRQILEIYLNRAPYGGNLEGIRAASRAYFGKDPRRLTTAEAALLVALPQSPEARRPDRYRGNAVEARGRVLNRMVLARIIDDETRDSAESEPISPKRRPFPKRAAHLTDRLRNGAGDVAHLTLDAELQDRLEGLAARAAREAGNRLSIGVLVADHQNGEILASVGSASYQAGARQGFVDMTQAIRSPGSTLKPLVYGLAFDQGLAHPETLIDDRPTSFGTYAPQNFDNIFRGTLRVRDALKLSLNIPVVSLTEALGPSRLVAHLRRAGTETTIPRGKPGLAVALGGVGVSLEGLVRLYAGLANGGRSVDLHSQLGHIPGESETVLTPEAAWMVGDILSEIPPPPGSGVAGLAYKTGTSYGHRDAWAIGYDGWHVIGVWLGRPDGTPVPGAFGGDLAAPILFESFAVLKPELDRLPPPPPGALLVSHAQLPRPLRQFRKRDAVFSENGGPELAFPPDGARIERVVGGIAVKVREGAAPFTWLADGRPVLTKSYERSAVLDLPGRGFVTLSVIDAEGRSARSNIRVD
ncbi:Multimodular transpeptidase-transglycosylase [Candidatus Rhodobacter oscarellae]|uniref:peptidoglycan glycosyltransferase n=1 Tax=Candidatus Rhodobacter oscarellae TaxID=1675527 RepID=A0A0J9EB73_9RHOB|nr:penicillin-binding protein 1C [Candidatus Rhodobacter lobularis]KMW58934.1 Multimodular transpeptidase-transglycosylase [Candidatus Rhodobacter lobularis]